MEKNTFVVKPSVKKADLPSFDKIIQDRTASGFIGSLKYVRQCKYIVIVGETVSFIGKINNVSVFQPIGKKSRVVVTFKSPKKINCAIINSIKWSSSNVRYKCLYSKNRIKSDSTLN